MAALRPSRSSRALRPRTTARRSRPNPRVAPPRGERASLQREARELGLSVGRQTLALLRAGYGFMEALESSLQEAGMRPEDLAAETSGRAAVAVGVSFSQGLAAGLGRAVGPRAASPRKR